MDRSSITHRRSIPSFTPRLALPAPTSFARRRPHFKAAIAPSPHSAPHPEYADQTARLENPACL